MNHTYKVIFSQALGKFVVVSENVKGRGKSSKAGVVLAMALVVGANAYAGPTGGSVVAGNANITYSGNLTTISQETNRAVINWNTFNIGKGETVQFNQPSANAATLNRVLTATPSVIDGILKSNGNVFLVNAAGVMIGKDATVNVGGLVASTLDMKDADFMAGKNHFEGDSTKSVENYGDITVSNGGIAALIGAKVNNAGYITAHEGSAMLVAAGSVTLTLGEGAAAHSLVIEKNILDALVEAGGAVRVGGGQIILAAHAANSLLKKAINQTGVLEAVSMTQQGGNIVLDGGAMGRVDLKGSVQADGKTGGKVVVTGHDVLVSGNVSATGEGKGGNVFIGGGYRGKDDTIQNAKNIAVTRSATVDVSSKIDGDAGQAIMFSTGSTQVKGDLKAKGGTLAGNGGLVETSGKVVQFDGKVDTKATNGKSGGYLLDPDIIIITASASEPGDADLPEIVGTDPGAGGSTSVGSTTTISKAALEAISSGYISLEADGYIRIEDLSANGGSGKITLQTDTDFELVTNNRDRPFSSIPGKSGDGGIYFINSSNSIETSGTGNISLRAGKYNSGLPVNAGLFNIGNIQVEDGDIELFGSSAVDIKGNVTATGNGSISIDADHDISQDGKLAIVSTISANTGSISLTGGRGVDIHGNIKLNEGSLYLDDVSGVGDHILSGTIEKTGADLYIENRLTMTGNNATIKSGGVLGFGDYIQFDDGVNATLIGTNFSIPYGFSSLGTSATVNIKAPDLISNISLDQYGGSGYSPILERLTGVTQVNVGSNDYRGKITMAGLADAQTLNVIANGTGGSIEFLDGGYMGGGSVQVRANSDITFTGVYNISATTSDIHTGGNLTFLNTNTRFYGARHNISVGNNFTNAVGNTLTADVVETRIYLNDSSKLTGSGYTLADGFHRYGCTLDGGCTTGAVVPTSGNGFLFKQAPVLNLIPDSKTITYGDANPLAGIGYTLTGFINGDNASSAVLTGTVGSVDFTTGPGFSSGGYANAGVHNLMVSQGTLANEMGYTFATPPGSGTLTVNKLDVTANVFSPSKTYNGNTISFLLATPSVSLLGDYFSVISSGNFSDKNVGSNKTVSYTNMLSGLDAGNYNLLNPTGSTTGTITPKSLTNSVTTYNKTYDQNTTATSEINISGKVTGDDVSATITSSNFSDKNAGTNKSVTSTAALSGADAGNYILAGGATKTSTATIFQKTLASGAYTYDKVYDGTRNATTEVSINGVLAGDTVTASVGSSLFDTKNVGNSKWVTTVIALSGADAANYRTSSTNEQTIAHITPRSVTATVSTQNKVYDGTTTATSSVSLSNVVAGDTVTGGLSSSTFSDKNVGNGKTVTSLTSLGGADAGNYVISGGSSKTSTANITPAELTYNVATQSARLYDGTTNAVTGVSITAGKIAGDTVNVVVLSSNYDNKNVGSGKTVTVVTGLTGADAGNYILSGGDTRYSTNKIITAKTLTTTTSTSNKVYDGTTNALSSLSLGGIVAGDDLGYNITSSVFDNKNVGTGKSVTTTATLTGADAANYRFATPTQSSTANVTAKSVDPINLVTSNKEYDGTRNASTTGGLSGVVGGDVVNLYVASSLFDTKNAGTGKAVASSLGLSGADASNYTLNSTTGNSFADITRKILAAPTFTVDNKVYDGFTFATSNVDSLTGIVSGDTVGVISVSAFTDKNVGNAKQVDVTFGLTGADRNNYILSSSTATGYADITPLALNVTNVVTANKVYDGTTNASTTASFDGVVGSDIVTAAIESSNFDTKNVGTGKQVNSIVALAGADAGNYTITGGSVTSTADINPKSIDPINVKTANKVYDGTLNATTTGQLSGVIAGDSVNLGTTSSLFGNKDAHNSKPVISTLTLTGADAGNYVLSSTTAETNAAITKKTLATPTFQLKDKVYDGSTFLSYSVDDPVGVINGDDVSLLSYGTFANKNVGNNKQVNISFSLMGIDQLNYRLASTSAVGYASIVPASVTAINLVTANKEYDRTTIASTTGGLSGVIGSDAVSLNVAAAFQSKDAANNKPVNNMLSLTGVDAGNYTLTNASPEITYANVTPKVLAAPVITAYDKAYDGSTFVNRDTGPLLGVIAGDTVSVLGLSSFADKNVGTNKTVTNNFSLNGADSGNYQLASSSSTTTASITKKVVTADSVSTANKVYDGTTTAVTTGSSSGFITGDAVSITTSASNFDNKNAGTGKTVTSTLALTGADAGNYDLSSTSATSFADITKKILTAGAGVSSKTYDGNTSASALPSFSNAQLVGGDLVNVFVSSANFVDKNAGFGKTVNVTLGLGGNDAANYQLATPAFTRTADITQKTVSTIISTANKVYDGTTTANTTVSIGGKVTGDDVGVVLNSSTFGDKSAGDTKLVTNDYSLTGADAGNYRFSMGGNQSTYANITKKILANPTVTIANRAYDGTTNASAAIGALSGLISGDNVAATYSASFRDKNVGNNKVVDVNLGLSGVDSGNYALTAPAETRTGNIFRRALLVGDIVTDNKVYDGTTDANTTANLTNIIEGDDVSIKYTSSFFDDKNVADSKQVQNYFGLQGADANNYTLFNNYEVSYANITPKMIRGSFSADDKTYDGTTSATLHVSTEASDVVAGDDVYVGGTGAFRNKNKGINKFVDVNYTLNGADAGNYYLQQDTDWNYANIYAKSISAINLFTNGKMYNRDTSTFSTADLSGVIAGDAVGVTVTSNFVDWNAGVNKAVTSTFALAGPDSANYVLSSTTGNSTATITPKLIAAPTVTAVNKVYDGNTTAAATIGALSGVIAGDTGGVVVNYVGNFNNKNVGTNKNVTYDLGLQGTSAGNYQLTSTQVIKNNGVIYSKALNVDNIASANKVYDGTTTATTTGQLSGLVAGDTANLQQTYSVFTNKNVGTGKEILTGWYLTGADAGNYSINNSFTQTYADITPKSISVQNLATANKVYDRTTTATSTGDLAGLVGGDAVTASITSNFDDFNAGVNKQVNSTFALAGADAANYTLASTAGTSTATITKKVLASPTVTVFNKEYDGSTYASASIGSLAGVIAGDSGAVAVYYDGNFDNKNAGTNKTVTVDLSLIGTRSDNYTLATPQVIKNNGRIFSKTIEVVDIVTANKVYDGTTAASTTGRLEGIVAGDTVNLGQAWSTFDNKNVGTAKDVTSFWTMSGVDAANYVIFNMESTSQASITPKQISAVNVRSFDKVYDGTTVAVTAADLQGLIGADVVTATTSASNFDNKNAGLGKTVTSTLALSGADAGNYILDNVNTTTTAGIAKKQISADGITTASKVYDGTTNAITSANTGLIIAGDAATVAVTSSNFSNKNVGVGKVVSSTLELSGADANNYYLDNPNVTTSADITQRVLSSVSASTLDKVYDGTTAADSTLIYDPTEIVSGDNVNLSIIGSDFDNKNAGFNKNVNTIFGLSGSDSGNYRLNSASSSSYASIEQRVVTATNITSANKVYDGTTAAITIGDLTGVMTGDDVAMATALSAFSDKNAGIGKTVTSSLTLAGADSNNYILSNESATSTANIDKKAVTAQVLSTLDKVYDGTTATYAYAGSDDFIASDMVGLATVTSDFADKNVGTGKTVTTKVELGGDDAGNYTLNNDTLTSTAAITKRQLNAINVVTQDKVYDGSAIATTTAELDDVIAGDAVTVSTVSSQFDNKNAGFNKNVNSVVAISGADAGNYELNSTNASSNASIDQRIISATNVTTANKVYDGTTAAVTTGALQNIIAGDDVVMATASSAFTDKNVGTGKTVTSSLTLAGADSNNYLLDNENAVSTADITPKHINAINVLTANKVYDGTTFAVTTAQVDGVVGGDLVGVGTYDSNFDNKNVGVGKTVTSTLGLYGDDAANYVLDNASATSTASITSKAVNIINVVTANKVYDGTTVASTTAQVDGVAAGDDVTAAMTSSTFADKNVGTNKQVNSVFSFGGTDAANYTFISNNAVSYADITPKTFAFALSTVTKVYDGSTTANTSLNGMLGVVAGDNVIVNIIGSNFEDRKAGNAKLVYTDVSYGGADIGNYILPSTMRTSLGTITPKGINLVNVVTGNKVYDGNTNASTTAGLSGLIGGDVVNATTTSSTFYNKNAGVGKAVNSVFSLTGADFESYYLISTNAASAADISRKDINSINGVTATKAYDGTTAATTTAQLSGVISGDAVSAVTISSVFDNKNAGTNKNVISGLALSGADAGNYNLDNTTLFTTGTITAKTINAINVTTADKVYDGTTSANTTAAIAGLVGGDTVGVSTTSSNFVDKNAGNGKTVNSVLSLTGVDAGNYVLDNANATSTAAITPKHVIATNATTANKTYDGTTNAVTTAELLDGIAGDSVSVTSSSASFSDKNVGSGKTVTSTLTLAGSDAGNYILDTVNATTTADITQKHINASNFQTLDKVYDGTTSANTVADLDGVVAGDVVTTAVVSSEFADKNAGNNKAVNSTLTIAGADAGNYILDNASATSTGNITPKHITATGVTTSNKVYDGTTAAITTATAQDLVAGDIVTVTTSSSAFDNKNVGTGKTVNSILALAGADAGNYVLDNQNATSTADVTQKHISAITATTSSKEYDGTTNATTTAVMDDAAAGDILNLDQLTSEFSDKNAGTGKTVTSTFALSGADAGNYILDSNTATSQADITQKHISATNIVSSNKVYDGSTAAVTTADLSGIIAGDSVSMATASSSFDNKNAGTGKTVTSSLALSGADAANYVLDNQTATSTADITAKHVNAVNVVTSNKVYDGTTAATTTAELDDLIAGDVVTVTSSSAAFADKNVGTGKAVTSQLILGGADASNYVLDNQNAASTANITTRLVTASDIVTANKVYDGTTTANTTATINNLIAGDSVSVSTVASSFNDKNAGLNKAVTTTFALSGADAGNYALDSATANSTGTITAKHINAANVTTANKVYDGATNATTTAALNDLVAGDTVTVTTSSSNFDTKNVGNGKNVTSTLTLAGADAGNYVLDNTNATSVANITPKHVSAVNVVTANKVYDGSTSASTTATVQDMVAGDVVTVTTTSSNFNDKNAGVNKTVTSTLSLSGVDAANYVLDNAGNASSTASITKKTISAISSTASKVYDGTTAAQTTASLRDVIAGDNVTVSTAGSVFNDKNVGNNKTVTTNLSLGGSDGANYVLDSTSSTNTASITPKHISAISVSTADKVYDGSAQATTTAALNGLVSGDNVNVSTQSSSFSDKNVGASKTVNSTLTLAGGDSANYVLDNAQATSTAAITPKHINASNVTTANREYNGTTAATTTAALSGIIGGDSVVTKALSSNFADKNAGNGKSVETTFALDGVDARNYVLDNQTATSTANITPKTLTTSGLVFGSKTYDGNRDAVSAISVGSLNGVIAGDDVKNAILNAEFSDKNAGSGKSVTATLTLTGADSANYIMATTTVNGLASITPKAISAVGGVAQDKVYDSNIIAQILGANLNGTISGDNVVVGATGSFSDKNAGINKAVTINYSLNGADASNYVLSQTVGASVATIFRKVIDFATTTSGPTEFVTKDAPLSTEGFNGSLQGVIAGDNVSAGAIGFMQGETISDASKPGSYRAVVTGLVGSDAANYELNGKSDYSVNNSVKILVKPSATVTSPGKSSKPPVFQNDVTFNPLYANGRPIETRGQVATAITITTDVIDLYKGANTAGGRSYTLPDGIDVSEIDPDLLYIPYDDVKLKPTSRGIAQSQYAISGILDTPKQEEPVEKTKK